MVSEAFNILIVDDDKDIHEVIKEALLLISAKSQTQESEHRINLKLEHAYQGQEALEKIKKSLESGLKLDLIILDMLMPPGINGAEVMKKISGGQNLNVLISTAYFHDLEVEIRSNASRFDKVFILQKPYSLKDFTESVKNILLKKEHSLCSQSLMHIK